jgi:predicted transposase YbfD/YdcC
MAAIAVDGKSLRGARQSGGQRTHLLSAWLHAPGVTIAQRGIGGKANEITEFVPLLNGVDLTDVVVTADALHAQKNHASYLSSQGAHYVFGLKKNQAKLLGHAKKALADIEYSYVFSERGHSRIEERKIQVAECSVGSGFDGASQVVAVSRTRSSLYGWLLSADTSYYITSLSGAQASPQQLANLIRGHWGIENRSHWVRDYAFDEDRCTVRKGGAPQILVGLRNLAISVLRLAGHTNVTKGLRWAGWNVDRPLTLLGL